MVNNERSNEEFQAVHNNILEILRVRLAALKLPLKDQASCIGTS